jgi:hypothetical protein
MQIVDDSALAPRVNLTSLRQEDERSNARAPKLWFSAQAEQAGYSHARVGTKLPVTAMPNSRIEMRLISVVP